MEVTFSGDVPGNLGRPCDRLAGILRTNFLRTQDFCMGSGNTCAAADYFNPPILSECSPTVNYTSCSVCPFSDEPLFPDTSLGNYTCGDLDKHFGTGLINVLVCDNFQLFAYDTCCNSSMPTTTPDTISPAPTLDPFVCELCGPGRDITIPDGVVVTSTQPDRTCAELEGAAATGAITKLQCPLLQLFSTSPCGCMPTSPTPAPIAETQKDIASTTPAPIAPEPTPTLEDVATPAPTDGVSSLLSSKSAMSLVGLSMAMVAYFAG
jgi:hypothetical protein